MGSVYEFTLTARATHQQAMLIGDEKPPGAQHGAGAPPSARGPALAPYSQGSYSQGSLGAGVGGVGNGRTPGTTPVRPGQRASRASSYVGLVDGGDSDDFDD
jgi:hypothetical protein